jgi:hypothetical protein
MAFVSTLVILLAAAYVQWVAAGLPYWAPSQPTLHGSGSPHGPPAWLQVSYYVNFLFIILLIRSGLHVLTVHPRFRGNVHGTPHTDWLRLTPVRVPIARVWSAKEDFQYLFLVMRCFVVFIVMVISLLVYTGFVTSMNPNAMGTDTTNATEFYLGLAVLGGLSTLAYLVKRNHLRMVHDSVTAFVTPVKSLFLDHGAAQAEFQW